MRVLLVTMPFASVERPAIGISLLKAGLAHDGVECDVLYANLVFAADVTLPVYDAISRRGPHRSLAGDWVFAEEVFGKDETRSARYLRDVVGDMSSEYLAALAAARAAVPSCLDRLMAEVPWSRYDIVGFTSFCEQNLAAMALAARVRAAHPQIRIVAGGANWHGEMGVAQLRVFAAVDIGFLGEADASFPEVVRRLGEGRSVSGVPGLAIRERDRVITTGPALPYDAVDELPIPDYSDYFAALEGSDAAECCAVTLSVEASRGCWWAERGPCRFCGLNGTARAYRAKGPDRLLAELRELVARWPGCAVDMVDNVVPDDFLTEVVPCLAEAPLGAPLSFEARPHLGCEVLDGVSRVGASLQVGIESLGDRVLGLMHKGLRAIDAVRLLRDCRARGLPVGWNIIMGTPGETAEDYEEMLVLLPAIRFLQPPASCAPLCLDRFSPYFEAYERWGFAGVRPHAPYAIVYPLDDELLWQLADSFDYEESLPLLVRACRYRLRAEVRSWQCAPDPGEVLLHPVASGCLEIRDTRHCAMGPTLRLSRLEEAVCLACGSPRSLAELEEVVRSSCPPGSAASMGLGEALERLLEARVLVRAGGRFLSLALPSGAVVTSEA